MDGIGAFLDRLGTLAGDALDRGLVIGEDFLRDELGLLSTPPGQGFTPFNNQTPAPAQSGGGWTAPGGIDATTLLLIAAAVVAGFLILKK